MTSTIQQFGELINNKGATGPVNIRSGPALTASAVQKPIGTKVKILDKKQPGDGYTWYKVSYDSTKEGWVRNDVIKILPAEAPQADDTRLYFETDKRQVRIYEKGSSLYMNVYNKQTDKTEISAAPTTKLPKDNKGWEKYIATKDGRTYQASFLRRSATQLQIINSSSGQDIEPSESGFAAKGTEYQQVA